MKRLLSLGLVSSLVLAALALDEPQPAPITARPDTILVADTGGAGVWYCPWVESSFERDGLIALASVVPSAAAFTFLNPEPGQEADEIQEAVGGPGGSVLSLADVVALRGDVPGFVEFDGGPAAAASVIESETSIAADLCISSVPKVWYVVGGSTLQNETLVLRLFNPFPEIAKVTVAPTSEFGAEPLTGLEGFAVAPRSWKDVAFHEELRLREVIGVTVTASEGTVIPVMAMSNADDDAIWTGTGLNRTWEFPTVRTAGLDPAVAIFNPNPDTVTVQFDIFTPDGALLDARSELVPPGSPVLIPLGDLADGAFGLKLRSDASIAAATVADMAGGLAVSEGVASPSTRWLLPGAGAAVRGTTSLWLMNSGTEPVTVTLLPLGPDAPSADKVALPAGAIRQVIVEGAGIYGYLADSLAAFSAAWSVQGPEGAAIAPATPIGD